MIVTEYQFCDSFCGRTDGNENKPMTAVENGAISLLAYCAENRRDALLAQWHPTRNDGLSPGEVVVGSHRQVWWRCDRGHEWQTRVADRTTRNEGCPYCSGRRTLPGENDLATLFPALAAQWDPAKNGTMTPDAVSPGSKKKVWWHCEKGHGWQAAIVDRAYKGTDCPYCAGRWVIPGETDLETCYPELAAQWDVEKNAPLTPRQILPCSNKRYWWHCALGHSYQMQPNSRVQRNSGCPYCAGKKVLVGFNDLATVEPLVAAQWHESLNGALTPEMVTMGCNKRAWWRCQDGHVWNALIYSRTGPNKRGCPVCAGNVRKKGGRVLAFEEAQVREAAGRELRKRAQATAAAAVAAP